MRVRFIKSAQNDLLTCGDYYQEIGGNKLARTMLGRIKGPIRALAAHPELAPAYELAPGVRRLVVAGGVFLVFYRVATAEVEVLHIRRAEREPLGVEELEVLVRDSIDDPRPNVPHDEVMAKAQGIINAARYEDVER